MANNFDANISYSIPVCSNSASNIDLVDWTGGKNGTKHGTEIKMRE